MKNIKNIDKTIFILTILFCIFGCVMILSASSASTLLRYNKPSFHFFIRQIVAIGIGTFIGFFLLFISIRKYYLFPYLLVGIIIVLLIYVLYAGKVGGNARSWIPIGIFNFQPSEAAKTIQIIFMGFFYHFLHKNKCKKMFLYFIPVVVGLIMAYLIYLESDFGGAFMLMGITMMVFISVPYIWKNRWKLIKASIIPILLIGIVFITNKEKILSNKKLQRFNYKNPCQRYDEETGYQVCNGFIAISNGGLFGVGLGKSSQKFLYLPESHTDFIFPIIVEETGVLVGILIIIGYFIYLYKFIKISKESLSLRNRIIAYGVFWYFAFHIIINLGGVLALIPLTGVPLPLLSYGGSFTMNVIILLFIIQRIVIENKKMRLNKAIDKI
ncbi:MAG: FtsW/RodA/SpoVE family cell cycle protein [Mollicutes bacterium]|nr:FtsW/RodA/SpoVE family cell cycle protein [Mollicutes bacterium]